MLYLAIKDSRYLLCCQFLPNLLFHLAELLVDIVLESEFDEHVSCLLNLVIEAHDLFLVGQVHTSVL